MVDKKVNRAELIGERVREKSFESVLLGDKDGALDILDDGIRELESLPKNESLPEMIKIMGDMGELGDTEKFSEGRKLLQDYDSTRGDEIDVDEERVESPQEKFQRNLAHANEKLELACCIQDWEVAKETYSKEAGLIPFFFEVDIEKPLAIFDKLKAVLAVGWLLESWTSSSSDPIATLPHLMLALQCYNWGCFLSNIFHKHFNRPAALVTILDHDWCSTLFISATRLCIQFAEMDSQVVKRPKDHEEIKPALNSTDWRIQALLFLERGKARSLLDAILQHKISENVSSERPRLLEGANNIANAVIAVMDRLSVKRHGHYSKSSISSNSDVESSSSLSTPSTSPRQHVDIKIKPSSGKSILNSLSLKSTRIIQKWQRAIQSVGGVGDNPIVPTKIESKDIQKILLHLPVDTAILEFGVDSNPERGSLVGIAMTRNIVATQDGHDNIKAVWHPLDPQELKELKRHITILRWNMNYRSHENVDKKKEIIDLLIQHSLVTDESDMEAKGELARRSLSKILLEPFSSVLENKSNLIIVPSNNLSHIPWSMIPLTSQPNSRLVVDDHCISMIPSLCIWDSLRIKSNQPPQESPKVLIVTNSPFEDSERKAIRRDGIQYSRMEALYLAQLHQETPFLADELRSDEFVQLVQESHIVHMSAHGDFDNAFPLKSKIHLFPDSLSVMDFRDLHTHASLVVFSTCLSGLSRTSDSGSSFSFAHALLGSGARAFIGTLWPVNDAATLIFMMIFYERLRDGISPVESLRGAKLAMRQLTKEDLDRRIEELSKLQDYPESKRYVYNLPWRLKLDLPNRDAEVFRQEQYWAPFVLTGYGNSPTYKKPDPGKRRRGGLENITNKRFANSRNLDSENVFVIEDVG